MQSLLMRSLLLQSSKITGIDFKAVVLHNFYSHPRSTSAWYDMAPFDILEILSLQEFINYHR